jgi:hypothetical protein
MAEWTDELKTTVIDMYKEAEPTADTSVEIVKNITDELGEGFTVNGVRMILSKAGVYIKKTPGTAAKTDSTKAPRVNKAESITALTEAIEALGMEADGDILGKLTGKAAVYFTSIISKTTEEETE